MDDAFQVESDGSALTWHLTGSTATATSSSPACGGSITITKRLVPANDPGLFGLRIDGDVAGGAEAVGDGDSTGTIAVAPGRRTVSESAAEGTGPSSATTRSRPSADAATPSSQPRAARPSR